MQHSEVIYHNPKSELQSDIKKVVIWLHGLGANGHDFVPIVPHLGLDFGVKFIFPHAPMMPVTINGGYVMPAWYDILEMSDLSRKVDIDHINKSAQRIRVIIDTEIARGVQACDIVLAGFSQGGAVAYHAAFGVSKIGGLLALSTYFATQESWEKIWQTAQKDTALPICIHHGLYDDVVSPTFSGSAKEFLQHQGFSVEHKFYSMAHQVCPEQIVDIGKWLSKVLG